jgi:hypothetical protein
MRIDYRLASFAATNVRATHARSPSKQLTRRAPRQMIVR